MARFMLTYLGGNPPSTPEEGQKHMAEYREWLQGLGDACISPANPIKNTQTVSPDGSVNSASQTGMSGYTVLEANSMDDALAMAKGCPFLGINGTLELSEMVDMPDMRQS